MGSPLWKVWDIEYGEVFVSVSASVQFVQSTLLWMFCRRFFVAAYLVLSVFFFFLSFFLSFLSFFHPSPLPFRGCSRQKKKVSQTEVESVYDPVITLPSLPYLPYLVQPQAPRTRSHAIGSGSCGSTLRLPTYLPVSRIGECLFLQFAMSMYVCVVIVLCCVGVFTIFAAWWVARHTTNGNWISRWAWLAAGWMDGWMGYFSALDKLDEGRGMDVGILPSSFFAFFFFFKQWPRREFRSTLPSRCGKSFGHGGCRLRGCCSNSQPAGSKAR